MHHQRIVVQSGRFRGGSWEGRGLSVSTIEPRTPVREEGPPIASNGEHICRIPNVPSPVAANKPPVITAITPSPPAAPPSSPNRPSTPTATASPGGTQQLSEGKINYEYTNWQAIAEVNKAESIAAAAIAALAAAAAGTTAAGTVPPLQGGHNRRLSQLIPDFPPQQLLNYRCQQRNQSQPLLLSRSSVNGSSFGASGGLASRPQHSPGDEVGPTPTDSLPQIIDGSGSGSFASIGSGLISSTLSVGSSSTSAGSSKLKPSGLTHTCRMLSNVDAAMMAVALPDLVEARSVTKPAVLQPLRPPPLLPPLQRPVATTPSGTVAAAVLLTSNSGSLAAVGGAQLAAGSRGDGNGSTRSPLLTKEARERGLRESPSAPNPPPIPVMTPAAASGTTIDVDKMPNTETKAPAGATSGDVTHILTPAHPQSSPNSVRISNFQSKLSSKPSPPYPPPTPPPPPPGTLSPAPSLLESSSSFPSTSSGRLRAVESGVLPRPSSSRRNPLQCLYSNSPARFTTAELRILDSLGPTASGGGSGASGASEASGSSGTCASVGGAIHNHATQDLLGGSGGINNGRQRGIFVLGVAGEASDNGADDLDVDGNGQGGGYGSGGKCCGGGKGRSDSERQTSKAVLKQSRSYFQSAAARPGAALEGHRLREEGGGGEVIAGGGGGHLPIVELPRTGHLPPLAFSISIPAAATAATTFPDPKAAAIAAAAAATAATTFPDPKAAAIAAAAAATAVPSQSSTFVTDTDATGGTSPLNIQPNNTVIFC
ncbi:hypothetical protein Vretimale_11095 [Volvox reticuliferus]|uniref:Uncharacterized protein n=1 Tax=Volvox reticuliferus TaxID=1737510 RepID=A0A8J4GHC6_9CHLO|nr:hypothetical protein Vretimale_11095 [Volvox reticuliferus]